MESELQSIVDRNVVSRTELEKAVITYFAKKCIEEKDIWGTEIKPKEFAEAFDQYKRNEVFGTLMYLSDSGIIKRNHDRSAYRPCNLIRLICREYLRDRPEIVNVSI